MPKENRLDEVAYWYALAEETIILAQQARDAEERRILLGIAEKYEKVAQFAHNYAGRVPASTNSAGRKKH